MRAGVTRGTAMAMESWKAHEVLSLLQIGARDDIEVEKQAAEA